ncbi:surfeit locus protein 6-domain-containing protein [Cercophora scortea]|uniref:Surfeit locus protein 6-domain-containing protein n=1 Tax=Cercophora scortea TaxID=314031 RepID=A0AAE0I756_9PEZI|nr:surfeit locus protein 6-domain-containing protein [Cercophora scortea]
MADSSLQERLRGHAKAFDGLLSLIPAKMYYGEDVSDQWKKKKQTKEEAKAAKRGKLDPDSELNRTAKDVLDERARNKRKLKELEADDESDASSEADDEEIEGIEKEKPGEGLKKKAPEAESTPKKLKLSEDAAVPATPATPAAPASEKKQAKEEKKLAKKLQKAEAREAKKAKVEKTTTNSDAVEGEQAASKPPNPKTPKKETPAKPAAKVEAEVEADADMAPIDVSGLNDESASADSTPNSPVFDSEAGTKNASVEPASTTTSVSSTIPPSEKPRHITVPADTTKLRERLSAKIDALRAARKVELVDGTPIRTREDLLEQRRYKQTQRKAHKREMRQLAKEQEDKKREEALSSVRNSPREILSPMAAVEDSTPNNFSFGRLAFGDGVQMSHDLSYEKSTAAKKKGPSDPKTALLKFENQKKRLEALDDDKRKEVLEKETWLAARRRAEGEKVLDDESLLKKAVKRKEKSKKKSEREWKDRAKAVEDGIKGRQHKREENIRKRKEEKGGKGKKKKSGVATKSKSRPGFEGGGFGGGKGKK